MPNDSQRPDVAVFIDFENVYVSVRDKLDANPNFEMIMDRCEDFGRVVIARAYADWYRYPRVTSALYANGIEPMYVPTYYYDRELGRTGRAIKNSVDMNLCIDAMKTLYTNTNIAKFVLATGDRDFIPLVNTIRQQGKEVIIIGIGGAASAHLAQSADEFIFYESLVGKKASDLQPDLPRAKMPEKGREYAEAEEEEAPSQPATQPRGRERERDREQREPEAPRVEVPSQPDIYDTLVSAINLARERGYVCSFGSLKLLMKELMGGDFKEGKYKDASGRPFAKFKDFVLEAERRGKVQVFTRGTVNEVFLPGEDPFKLSQFAQEIKEEPGMPVIPVSEIETQPESRASVLSNGRRRRRRSRGGQRPGAPALDGTMPLDESGDDVEELELAELILPDLSFDDQPDEVFEAPIEPVEAPADLVDIGMAEPAEDIAAIESLDQAETIAQAAEPAQPAAEHADGDQPSQPSSQPFTDAEWQLLHEAVARFERPASFAQIHDALRNARNSAGINRTNEELRSLIKQAINAGALERIGKGNRASYRLAQPAEAIDQGQGAAQSPSDQPERVAPQHAPAEQPSALPGLVVPEIAAADQTAMIEASAAPSKAPSKRSRPRRKPAAEAPAEAASPPVAEAAPVAVSAPAQKPARSSRKKAAPAETPTAEAPAAAPAKPPRSRRKKTESAE